MKLKTIIFEKTKQYLPFLIIALHFSLVMANLWWNSLVVDEPYHIASGLSHYSEGNFRADQVNPPLARMISVLPLLPQLPAYDRSTIIDEPGARSEWALGMSWVDRNGPEVVWQTRLARLAGLGWSLLGACLLYRLVDRHRGKSAAILALAVWCFDPTMIALAAVVTADLPAAVAAIGAASAYDKLLSNEGHRVSWPITIYAGLWLGIALLVKFTILILPIYWLAWSVGRGLLSRRNAGDARMPLGRHLFSWFVVVVVAVAVVNAGYGFQGSFRQLESFRFVSRTFSGHPPVKVEEAISGDWGNRFVGTALGGLPIPLPEDFVLGIDVQRRDFENPGPSYVNGHWSIRGWWWFYMHAVMIKEPIPWLFFLAWASVCLLRSPSYSAKGNMEWLEGLGLTVFVFVSAQYGFSHHMRYVLPAYPFIYIFLSRIACCSSGRISDRTAPEDGRPLEPRSNEVMRRVRWALTIWMAWIAIISTPHCLSYFNPLVGGPSEGHRYLLMSNSDWGQGLLLLKRWIDDHPGAVPLRVSYLGPMSPADVGIYAPAVPPLHAAQHEARKEGLRPSEPSPSYDAISASLLHFPNYNYAYLKSCEPYTTIGGSILIYRDADKRKTND